MKFLLISILVILFIGCANPTFTPVQYGWDIDDLVARDTARYGAIVEYNSEYLMHGSFYIDVEYQTAKVWYKSNYVEIENSWETALVINY